MRQVAVVTGGARGLGRHIALEFAKNGYLVAFSYHGSAPGAMRLGEELEALGQPCRYGELDVASEEEVSTFLCGVEDAFGRIDVLVNNAGIYRNALIEQMALEDWDRVLGVNLTGSFLCIKHVFPIMKRQGSGAILNVCSVMGETGIYGACGYGASKSGLIGLTKSAALEGARHDITVNALSVGVTDEGMSLTLSEKAKASLLKKIPVGYPGRAEELAKTAVWLCGEEMRYITGQVVRFNGGMYM